MTRIDHIANLDALPALEALDRAPAASAAPQPFADFSAFEAPVVAGAPAVTAPADPMQAAWLVAAHLLAG